VDFSNCAQYGPLQFEAELMDSRIFKQGRYTPVGTDDSNALEPVQLAASWRGVVDDEKFRNDCVKSRPVHDGRGKQTLHSQK
jgi:hypothetical protein